MKSVYFCVSGRKVLTLIVVLLWLIDLLSRVVDIGPFLDNRMM